MADNLFLVEFDLRDESCLVCGGEVEQIEGHMDTLDWVGFAVVIVRCRECRQRFALRYEGEVDDPLVQEEWSERLVRYRASRIERGLCV